MAIQRLFVLVNLILITTGTYLFVDNSYDFLKNRFEDVEIKTPEVKQKPSFTRERRKTVSSYAPITRRNIFKASSAEEDKEEDTGVDVENLEETELKLKLWGTVTGDKDKAYAVIADLTNKREQDLYRIGDTIQTATVKMILREKVVLNINGEDKSLSMEEKKDTGGGPPRDFEPSRPKVGSLPGEDGDADTVSLDRSDIEKSLENINELMRQIKIRPHFTNGKPDGLALSSIRRDSIFKDMGLRNGDIITGVDGTPIESVDDALKFYESISSASALSLQIKRRGKPKTIDFVIN